MIQNFDTATVFRFCSPLSTPCAWDKIVVVETAILRSKCLFNQKPWQFVLVFHQQAQHSLLDLGYLASQPCGRRCSEVIWPRSLPSGCFPFVTVSLWPVKTGGQCFFSQAIAKFTVYGKCFWGRPGLFPHKCKLIEIRIRSLKQLQALADTLLSCLH